MRFASENGIIAIGMTLVILTGGIDLSVGAVLALCAVGAAAFMTRYDLDTAPTVLLVLALGGLVGIVNGLVTTRFNIQSFITTLAMLGVARGVASLWSGGYAIPLAFGDGAGLAPPSFKAIFAGQVNLLGLEIPAPVFYFLGVGLIASFLLRRTGFGRHVYAVGGNETAARLSGVDVDRVKVIVFAISGCWPDWRRCSMRPWSTRGATSTATATSSMPSPRSSSGAPASPAASARSLVR